VVVILCFDAIMALVSCAACVCVFAGFAVPVDTMAIGLNIGIVIAYGGRLVTTRRLRNKALFDDDWIIDKRVKNPRPLKWAMGLIIASGFAVCFFSLRQMVLHLSLTMTHEDSKIASQGLFTGLFALLTAYYAVEVLAINSYRIFEKSEIEKFRRRGILW
jgi:hypothetical protein